MTRPLVLRFPRTMGDAFKGPDYAASLERPWPPLWKRLVQHIREVLA